MSYQEDSLAEFCHARYGSGVIRPDAVCCGIIVVAAAIGLAAGVISRCCRPSPVQESVQVDKDA